MSNDEPQPSNTIQERGSTNRLVIWVLLDANRWIITAGLALCLFAFFVLVGVLDPSPLRQLMAQKDPVETTFQAFVGAIITGVTLVVTIDQLVLSNQLGPLGEQRERLTESLEFRRDAESVLESVSPPEPAAFLLALVDASSERAERLGEAIAVIDEDGDGGDVTDADDSSDDDGHGGHSDVDDRFAERVDRFVDGLTTNARSVGERLDTARFGRFETLRAALDYNYSWKIYEARRLRREREDSGDLTDDERAAFDDVIDVLTFFGPAREYFRGLYFQWELVRLSRVILAVAVPALAVSIAVLLFVDDAVLTGTTLGVENMIWLISAAATIGTVPFLILVSYVLRIVTITQRTLATGPFILRETERTADIDWDE